MSELTSGPVGRALNKGGPDWWRGAVIYQIYPRSYQDSNGDGIGDLAGITTRLGHIAELGADAIWLSPFFPSPMKDFGYDVSDYRGVDAIFGGLDDFDAMVAEAHRLGLRVIIDQVLSHTSDQHPWFAESRADRTNAKADWYVWADAKPDGGPPNNWLSIFGGSAWHWDTARGQYYLHNFLSEQPDLNYHSLAVQDALLSEVRFWLDRGVDGFRLDTVNFYFHSAGLQDNPPHGSMQGDANPYNWQSHRFDKNQPENLGFLKRFRALLDEYPGTTSVGEVGDWEGAVEIMAAYTSGGDKLHMCYTFDFLNDLFTPPHFRSHIEAFEAIAADGWPCWAFSNHDVRRHVSRWATNEVDEATIARLAAAMLLCLRGSICLYQGEELGLPEAELAYEDLQDPVGIRFWPKLKGRDGCRTPMVWTGSDANGGFTQARPWLPVPVGHRALAVDRQGDADTSLVEHYKRLLALRAEETALRSGAIDFVDAPEGVLAFTRTSEKKKILCAFNLTAEPVVWSYHEAAEFGPIPEFSSYGTLEGVQLMLPAYDFFLAERVF